MLYPANLTITPHANYYCCLQILVEETEAPRGEESLANPQDAMY